MDKAPSYQAALLVTTAASFLTPFMSSSISIALPSIGDELEMNAILLGWVATAYILAQVTFLVPVGRIADIRGRKRIFIYGMLAWTVAALLSATSTSAIMLISSRVLQGIGAAMISSTAIAIITSVFSAQQRGRALGINAAAVYAGLCFGPFLGGLLTHYFGWRSIFWANVPLGLIMMVFTLWKLRGEWADAKSEKFDITGSIIYGLMLISIMYGLTILPKMAGVGLIVAGALGIVAFIKRENRIKHPILDISLFKNNTVFTFSNLAALISYCATFGVAFLLSLYLQYLRGLSPQNAGFVLVSAPAVQAIFSPLAGRLSDKIEPRIIASAGMALTTIGLLLFSFLNESTSIIFIVASLILLGFGFALFSSPNTNAVMSSAEKKSYGGASAILATMRHIGGMLSIGIVMFLFSIYIGRVEITPEYYSHFLKSVNTAFIIFTVFCFVGIFASLARGKVR